MALHKLVRRSYGGKLRVSNKYQNLHSFKEGVILLCQSILEMRRVSHLHGSTLFIIPLIPLRCSQFWSLVTRVSIPILTTPTDIFQLTFNFLKFGTTCKISSYIIILFKNPAIWLTRSILTWFKNPAIWLTRVIFVHTGTTYFPNMEIAQEYSKWYEFTL